MDLEGILQDVRTQIQQFHDKNPNGVIVLRWATATGKSKLSLLLSEFFSCEIISADSRQIFRYMDIATDKVSEQIRQKVPHHQINIIDPDENYTAGQRQHDTFEIISQIQQRWKIPMIVGGTWLYIDTIYKNFSLPTIPPNPKLRIDLEKKEAESPGWLHAELEKVDPTQAASIHPKSLRYLIRALEIFYMTGKTKTELFVQQPLPFPLLMIGLRREKEDSNTRIDTRIQEMVKQGLIQEVEWLLARGYGAWLQSMQGIWYKETLAYLDGQYDKETLIEQIQIATHRLAKRQRTWFRRYIADSQTQQDDKIKHLIYTLS